MKKECIILHLFCSLFVQSCTADSVKNLGSGYFYRDEGGNVKDIFAKGLMVERYRLLYLTMSITMNILLQNKSLNILKRPYIKENMNMEQTIVCFIG